MKELQHIKLVISRAENGYTINAFDGGFEPENLGGCYVASSQDKAANVVRKILAERFPKERPETPDDDGSG